MDKVECVVIGAGVIGLAVARRLAQAGREVIVLEAAEAIGTVTSSRNSPVCLRHVLPNHVPVSEALIMSGQLP